MFLAGLSAQMAHRARRRDFEQRVLCQAGDLLLAGLRFTRDLPRAEGLVQQTMLRAWYEFDDSTIGTACRVWLFKIMLSLWNCGTSPSETFARFNSEQTGIEVLRPLQWEGNAEVKNSLDRLRDDLRILLLLFAVDEFSCTEISEILTVPIDTVISNLALARNLVKSDLCMRPISRAAG
jgi:RNA polymerase sigma-70 factor, ECF subfamily